MNRPEHVEVVLDAPRYKPGARASALIRSPFAGTALVTLETDKVVHTQVIELSAASERIEFDVPESLRGGAFLSASVIRAVDPAQEDWLPHRAMGLARLATEHPGKLMTVNLTAPPSCSPGATIDILVESVMSQADAPAFAHVWAVDEGILLTTGYRQPDAIAHFFAPRAMFIESSDIFADLLPDTARPASMERIGADEGDDSDSLRSNPVSGRQRAAAVVWRTVEQFGTDGTLNVQLNVPQMTGALRIMAVVARGDQYGAASVPVVVAAPLMCEASWPRVVAPGDAFETPVKIFNSTDHPLAARLAIDVSGPLEIDPVAISGKSEIPAKGSSTIWVASKATGMGAVHVSVVASADSPDAGTLTAETDADFTSRPAAPLHSESTFVTIKAGEKLDLDPPAGYLPSAVQRNVTLSANPTVDLRPAVEQVIDYPYGCVEQTTSGLIAMLYAADLVSLNAPSTDRVAAISKMMDAGIARLWSMQTRDGGLGYWPGALESHPWGTTYAAQFLATASKAGFHVEQGFKDELARYLDRRLVSATSDELSDNMRAGICHALAAFNRPATGWMQHLSLSPKELDMGGRAALAAAWIAVGRKDLAAEVLKDDTLSQSIATTTSGRFVSQTQAEAALLSTLLDLDPRHPWIGPLVQRLNGRRDRGRWGTTLENAAAISALCKYQLSRDEPAEFEGTLACGGDRYTFNSAGTSQFMLADPSQVAQLETSGRGDIHVCITTTGRLLDESIKPFERQMTLKREWLDRDGKPLDAAKLRVGDLIHVRVTLAGPALTDGNTVDNVAVVDVLPGGTEIENPRLATSAIAAAGSDDRPDRTEFLDDRVVIFTSVGREKRQFDYYLRATTAGAFDAPPIEASCMYDPAFAALVAGGRVEIAK